MFVAVAKERACFGCLRGKIAESERRLRGISYEEGRLLEGEESLRKIDEMREFLQRSWERGW